MKLLDNILDCRLVLLCMLMIEHLTIRISKIGVLSKFPPSLLNIARMMWQTQFVRRENMN